MHRERRSICEPCRNVDICVVWIRSFALNPCCQNVHNSLGQRLAGLHGLHLDFLVNIGGNLYSNLFVAFGHERNNDTSRTKVNYYVDELFVIV